MIKNIYKEFKPSKELSDLVEVYWYSYRIGDLDNSLILPDTCMDILFNIQDIKRGESSKFIGLMLETSEHVSRQVTEYFGVRFKPFSIVKYLNIDANHLTDVSLDLSILFKNDAKSLEYQIIDTDDNMSRIKVIEQFLLNLKNQNIKSDPVIESALDRINLNLGDIKINTLAKDLFISEKQFQRKFKQKIGTTPKKFIDILKLRNLTQDMKVKNLDIQELVYNYGFYDYSHYLKVMKKYYYKK